MNSNSLLTNNRTVVLAFLAAVLLFSAGCVKRVVTTSLAGLLGSGRSSAPAAKIAGAARRPAAKTARWPDDSLREVFALQARGAFNPATDDRRIQLWNARLRLDPQDARARLELAAIYEQYSLFEEALEQYTRALNLLPDSQSALAEAAAVGLGRAGTAVGRSAEAIPVLAAFVKRAPGATEAWNQLGLLYDQRGERAAAEQAFRRAVELRPGSDRLHNNLGYNLLLQGRLEAAEAELRRAVQLDPNSATAYNNLGMVLARRGDLQGARREFLAHGDPAAAHNNLAVVLLEMGEYERSRDELVQALRARHYFPPAIENFKLVQGLLRQRSEMLAAGANLPLARLRLPAALSSAPFGRGDAGASLVVPAGQMPIQAPGAGAGSKPVPRTSEPNREKP